MDALEACGSGKGRVNRDGASGFGPSGPLSCEMRDVNVRSLIFAVGLDLNAESPAAVVLR